MRVSELTRLSELGRSILFYRLSLCCYLEYVVGSFQACESLMIAISGACCSEHNFGSGDGVASTKLSPLARAQSTRSALRSSKYISIQLLNVGEGRGHNFTLSNFFCFLGDVLEKLKNNEKILDLAGKILGNSNLLFEKHVL